MKQISANITGSLIINGTDVTNVTISSSAWSGSFSTRVSNLESFSGSINSYTASNNTNISNLNATTSSLNLYTGSNNTNISNLNATSASLNLASGSAITRLNAIEVVTGSNISRLNSIESTTGSLNTASGSAITRLNALEVTSGSNITRISALESASGSAITRLNSIESTTGSLNAASGSAITRLNSIESTTGSLNTASGSAISRLSSLESKTGSYATTGSNTFVSPQYISCTANPTGFTTTASLYTDGGLRVTRDAYISGTLYLNNVTVYGTQSIAYISSSQLNIASNLITVNTATPSVQFGGLAVYDSGSTGLTGSILWDSTNNRWIYSNPSGSTYDGGMLISGPRNSSGLGNEVGTTACMLMAGQGGDHITSSMIYHSTTVTCIPNTLIGSTICSSTTCAGTAVFGNTGAGSYSLAITNNDQSNARIRLTNTGTGGGIFSLVAGNPGASNAGLAIYDENCSSTRVYINSAGSVGIGTSSPSATFHVNAGAVSTPRGGGFTKYFFTSNNASATYFELQTTGSATTNDILFSQGSTGNYGIIGYDQLNDTMRVYTSSNIRFKIDGSGIACFACQVCAPSFRGGDSSNTSNGLSALNASTSQATIYSYNYCSAGWSIYSAQGVNYFAGNVGIGNSGPSYKLDISLPTTCTAVVARFNSPSYDEVHISAGLSNYIGTNSTSAFSLRTTNTNRLTIAGTGEACFACIVCAPSFYGSTSIGSPDFYNMVGYPYNTNFGSGADATTTTIRAGSTAGYQSCIVLTGQNGASPTQSVMIYTSSARRLLIDSAGISCFANVVCMPSTAVISGGGNTLILKKGTGSPAIAFAGTSDEAAFLVEGISGGGMKWYTSPAGCTLSNAVWNAKFNMDVNGMSTFSCQVCSVNGFRTGDNSYLTKSSIRLRSANDGNYLDIQSTNTCNIISSNYGTADTPIIIGTYNGYQANQLFLATNCNIGIGTNGPVNKIHIENGGMFFQASNIDTDGIHQPLTWNPQTSNLKNTIIGTVSTDYLSVDPANGSLAIRIGGSGGLYGGDPGFMNAGMQVLIYANGGDGALGGGYIQFLTKTNATSYSCNGSVRLTINPDGIATFCCNVCTTKYLTVGAQGGSDVVFLGGGSGVGATIEARYADGNPNVHLAGNGNSWLNRTYGSVGIGTCSPAYLLDVSGATRTGTLLVSNNTTTTWCVGRIDNARTNTWYTIYTWPGIYDGAFALAQLGYEDNNGDGANAHALWMTTGAAYSTGFGVSQIGGATNLCLQRSGQSLQALITGVTDRTGGAYLGFTVQTMNVAS